MIEGVDDVLEMVRVRYEVGDVLYDTVMGAEVK